jgi:hypothetical protein
MVQWMSDEVWRASNCRYGKERSNRWPTKAGMPQPQEGSPRRLRSDIIVLAWI